MKLIPSVVPSLPPLAWGALVLSDEVYLRCGTHVEWGENFFFEGAWNGEFSELNFLEATFVAGSGARLCGHEIQFITPSHTLERLHSVRIGDGVFVTNSTVWAFTEGGGSPDPSFPFYDRDFLSILDGLARVRDVVPAGGGAAVHLHHYARFSVDPALEIRVLQRPEEDPFVDFEDYERRVSASVAALISNARDSRRGRPFEPITTISAGYDSPAVSVFAVRHGCREALTFRAARENFGVEDDSGRDVAGFLGLSVEEFDRNEYRTRDDRPEAEFLATGNGGEDVVMCGFERVLADRLLFTGFRGDTVWARSNEDPMPSRDFVQKDPSGSSLGEFRLRVGFVHVPLPAMTFLQHPSIQSVSNSEQMDPWSVAGAAGSGIRARLMASRGLAGAGYDRPLARRLAEESGVPRDAFGWKKAAISQPFYNNEDLEDKMSAASLADFRIYQDRVQPSPSPKHRLAAAAGSLVHSANSLLQKLARLVDLEIPLVVPRRYRQPIAENAYAFHWAFDLLRPRYEDAACRESPEGRAGTQMA